MDNRVQKPSFTGPEGVAALLAYLTKSPCEARTWEAVSGWMKQRLQDPACQAIVESLELSFLRKPRTDPATCIIDWRVKTLAESLHCVFEVQELCGGQLQMVCLDINNSADDVCFSRVSYTDEGSGGRSWRCQEMPEGTALKQLDEPWAKQAMAYFNSLNVALKGFIDPWLAPATVEVRMTP